MTLQIERSSQFKRDYKRVKRQGADLDKLLHSIRQLAAGEILDPQQRDHILQGNWRGYRECHIEPDWLLIYKIEEDTLRLVGLEAIVNSLANSIHDIQSSIAW